MAVIHFWMSLNICKSMFLVIRTICTNIKIIFCDSIAIISNISLPNVEYMDPILFVPYPGVILAKVIQNSACITKSKFTLMKTENSSSFLIRVFAYSFDYMWSFYQSFDWYIFFYLKIWSYYSFFIGFVIVIIKLM